MGPIFNICFPHVEHTSCWLQIYWQYNKYDSVEDQPKLLQVKVDTGEESG